MLTRSWALSQGMWGLHAPGNKPNFKATGSEVAARELIKAMSQGSHYHRIS